MQPNTARRDSPQLRRLPLLGFKVVPKQQRISQIHLSWKRRKIRSSLRLASVFRPTQEHPRCKTREVDRELLTTHVIIARERIAVGALAGSWSYLAHSIHHGNWVCAPFLRILKQSTTPLISGIGCAHGAGAPFFLQAKKTAMTWHNLADSVMGGIFAIIVGAPLARRILNPNMPLPRATESYP